MATGTKQRFSDEANEHFTYESAEKLLDNMEHLEQMIEQHKKVQRPRLQTLQNYFKGNNETILKDNRRREEHLADNRAVHNFGEYVCVFIQGYMFGIPLKTTYDDKKISEFIMEINRINDADEHNSEIGLDQSIYGRAYELLYRNENDEYRFTQVDVLNTFVIYDESVERNSIAAVRYFKNKWSGEESVHLYTADRIYKMVYDDSGKLVFTHSNSEEESEGEVNYFQGVPIIEYENNKFRQGDFENVLALIDMYDGAQSDLANYSEDLNDAMLKIVGSLDLDVEEAKEMKEKNILFLRTEPNVDGKETNADADYIYKQYDVAGSEAYKTRIANDIHLFTATPNLSDENFAGNMSGEVMKYKLFLMEQKRAAKERRFKRALRERYRLISNMMQTASEGVIDVSKLTITFTENLPKNVEGDMQWFTNAGGQLSQRTMISQLRFVDNPDEEIEQLEEEEKQRPINQPQYDFEERQHQNSKKQQEEVNEDGE
ncbi:phage portal protein [Oceanobacillus oncorhynchi subsp. oncorhynchi]|uniref:phage portal protein n=1 Tax=Oceanobacillus oncorhynchi TaxID=545501 RepID=UPI0031D6DFEA